jgi:DNA repair protein RadC
MTIPVAALDRPLPSLRGHPVLTPSPTGERPRERLLAAGLSSLSDADLVAVLLDTGTAGRPARSVAADLLQSVGGLRRLGLRAPEEIARLPGLGTTRAARLVAALEMGRRSLAETLGRGDVFRVSADVFRHYHPLLRDLRVEQFRALLLDGKHRVLRHELVSQGTLTSSPVHPREVFSSAIRHGAAALILVHNHPSGDPSPSADDLEVTRRLASVGDLVGIRILDHVIVGDGSYTSLADRGLMG